MEGAIQLLEQRAHRVVSGVVALPGPAVVSVLNREGSQRRREELDAMREIVERPLEVVKVGIAGPDHGAFPECPKR